MKTNDKRPFMNVIYNNAEIFYFIGHFGTRWSWGLKSSSGGLSLGGKVAVRKSINEIRLWGWTLILLTASKAALKNKSDAKFL